MNVFAPVSTKVEGYVDDKRERNTYNNQKMPE